MNELMLYLITILHFLTVMFVVLVPFFGNDKLLLLHVIIVPFIMFHWILNDNTCFLSSVETILRKKIYGKVERYECFTCRFFDPIYDFRSNYDKFSKMIYIITTILWFISIGRLYYKYCADKTSFNYGVGSNS